MKKFSEWVMALLFSGTLLILMAATILLPKERYSYYENRNLSAFPEISVESVASGKVFGELELSGGYGCLRAGFFENCTDRKNNWRFYSGRIA